MRTLILATAFAISFCACRDISVPHVDDPKNVVVNGEPITHRAFIEKYCIGKPDNETCIKVQNAGSAAAVRSKAGIPRF